jgi:Holliday junction resolvasome RuvABC endonuclease subunit
MRILSLDPAGSDFGIVGIELNKESQSLSIYFNFLLQSPEDFNISQKNNYVAHSAATIISHIKPDVIVSEKPFGIGFSNQSLKELIGALKAEIWQNIKWQSVSEARRAVIGDGHGASDKLKTSEWLLEYPWSISAKRLIKSQIDNSDINNKKGFDILDAILHGVCYLVINEGLIVRHKPKKEKKKKLKQEKL